MNCYKNGQKLPLKNFAHTSHSLISFASTTQSKSNLSKMLMSHNSHAAQPQTTNTRKTNTKTKTKTQEQHH